MLPLPEPERDLHPFGADAQSDDRGAAFQLDSVEHHHRQTDIVEATGHQLPERLARALHEHT